MGWSTGSVLMTDIIAALKVKVPDDKLRQEVYEALIPNFEEYDCDTLDECLDDDDAFAAAYKEVGFFTSEENENEEEDPYYEDE